MWIELVWREAELQTKRTPILGTSPHLHISTSSKISNVLKLISLKDTGSIDIPMKVPVTTTTPASQSPVCASPSEVVSRDSRIPVFESTHPSMGWSFWLSSRMSFCHHSIQMSLLCRYICTSLHIIAYLKWPWSPVLQVGRLHVFSFCSLAISLSSDKFPHTKETCWYKRCGKPRMPTWC